MALNPTGFNTSLNSSPNAFGAGVMPDSTPKNNASTPLTTSESTTASANLSPSTPNQTILIIGGILSTLLAGGLLFWQRENIASLLGKSSKSVPSSSASRYLCQSSRCTCYDGYSTHAER